MALRTWTRHPAHRSLGIAVMALAVALVVPVTFSDPNGVDPYAVRLAVTALLMTLAARLDTRLAFALPVMLALTGIALPYSLFAGGPALMNAVLRSQAPAPIVEFAIANGLQLLAITILCGIARRAATLTPDLRFRVSPRAFAAAAAGIVALLIGGWLIPAQLLGRVAVQPVQLHAQGLALVVGDMLQGYTQELQFRGLLMGTLETTMSRRAANATQAVVFGLAHLAFVYQGPLGPFVPLTIALGWLFGWMTQRFESVWPAMLIHGVADVLVDVVIVNGLYGL